MRVPKKSRRLLAGVIAAPLALGALTALPSLASTSSGTQPAPASAKSTRALHSRVHTLPTGDHVEVVGGHVHYLPAPGHKGTAVTSEVNGRLTVVPVSALCTLSSLDGFQIAGPAPAGVTAQYAMGLLKIKALDHQGKPAAIAEVIVVNVDDPQRAAWDGIMASGDARVQVPAGHYSVAVAIFNSDAQGNEVENDLLTVTDVTVPATGTTVTLDGRTASLVSVKTPQPSTSTDMVAGWIRGSSKAIVRLDVGAKAGTKLYVGSAAKPAVGVMRFSFARA